MAFGSANAAVLQPKMKTATTSQRQKAVSKSDRMRAFKGDKGDKAEARRAAAKRIVRKAASIAAPADNPADVISETPAGELKQYEKTGFAYGYSRFEGLISQDILGNVVNVVKSEDGKKLYVQNPVYFNTLSAGNWIVGDIEGDKVSFTFPQLVDVDGTYDEDGNLVGDPYFDYALLMIWDDKEEFYVPAEDQTYTMTIAADGTLTSDKPEDVMIGVADYWEEDEVAEDEEPGWAWIGQGDFYFSLKPFDKVAPELPADVEMTDWKMIEDVYVNDVKVGFKDDKVYIQGLFAQNPEGLVTGTVKGNTITVAGGQYMGLYESNTTYFLSGSVVQKTDEEGTYDSFEPGKELVFDYDADKKVIKSDKAYCISLAADEVLYYQMTQKPYICVPATDFTVKALPTPVLDVFYDIDEEAGYEAETYFIFPLIDADKNVLPADKLFYEVLLDGEVYTFMNDEYLLPEGVESMTRVPYDFNSPESDDEYYYPELQAMGQEHYFVIHALGFETLGVRTVYVPSADAEPVYSDVLYMPGYASIKHVESTAGESSVEFFNLQGQRVSAPARGIVIRRAVLSDGTVKTSKVAVK